MIMHATRLNGKGAGTIAIPAHARGWSLSQMPLSVRLGGVLQKMGFRQVGDLQGISFDQVLSMRNCGQRSIRELAELVRRVQAGEFDFGRIKGSGLEHLISQVDTAVEAVSDREREMLLLRLGDRDQTPLTLEEIGEKFGLTRERVRQVVDLLYQRVARHGGPSTFVFLRRLAEKCLSTVCPLTPDLLVLWLGPKAADCRHPGAFYVRLFSELDSEMPAWPEGQKPYPNLDARTREIIRPVVEVLRANISPLPIAELFRRVGEQQPGLNLNPGELLRALKQCASITVDTTVPDHPLARLASLRICDWVQRVLAQSDRPLRPEEIIRRARRIFGDEVPPISIGGLRNSLRPEQGIFLLDRRAFGMQQHIQLPERLWGKARADVAKLLEEENRPVSTREILRDKRFGWASQTNVHEVAHILRQDERFVDLGRFLFAMRAWGQQEREHIKDLIPEVLKEAGHPMTATDILHQIRRKRSVGRATISAVIRNHEGVRPLGFGYYGLKGWKEMDRSFFVAQPLLVRRMILSSQPPLTFGGLCARLKIPVKGRLAAQLWDTIRGVRRIRTYPNELGPDTAICHKTWKKPAAA